MTVGLFLQYIVVALAVLLSACVVLHKQAPNAMRRLRISIALPLLRDGRSSWIRALGRRIAPAAMTTGACGGCDGCSPGR